MIRGLVISLPKPIHWSPNPAPQNECIWRSDWYLRKRGNLDTQSHAVSCAQDRARRCFIPLDLKNRFWIHWESILVILGIALYKVTGNTELANTEPWILNHSWFCRPQGKCRARFVQISGLDISIHLWLHNFLSCMFLFKGSLFSIYCWCINTVLVVSRIRAHTRTELGKRVFPPSGTSSY